MRCFWILSGLLLLTGCGSVMGPSSSLTGNWAANISVRGSSLTLSLMQSGTSVTGTGQYSLEAGRSGTLAVTGVFHDPSFTLNLAYDYGLSATYTGVLSGDRLEGMIQYQNPPEPAAPLEFTRR